MPLCSRRIRPTCSSGVRMICWVIRHCQKVCKGRGHVQATFSMHVCSRRVCRDLSVQCCLPSCQYGGRNYSRDDAGAAEGSCSVIDIGLCSAGRHGVCSISTPPPNTLQIRHELNVQRFNYFIRAGCSAHMACRHAGIAVTLLRTYCLGRRQVLIRSISGFVFCSV